jgi:hypothetical protein
VPIATLKTASRPQGKRENLFAKKSNTFAKENTVLVRANRRLL